MMLQWIEGALLLVFFAEMAAKVGISRTNGQPRKGSGRHPAFEEGKKHP